MKQSNFSSSEDFSVAKKPRNISQLPECWRIYWPSEESLFQVIINDPFLKV